MRAVREVVVARSHGRALAVRCGARHGQAWPRAAGRCQRGIFRNGYLNYSFLFYLFPGWCGGRGCCCYRCSFYPDSGFHPGSGGNDADRRFVGRALAASSYPIQQQRGALNRTEPNRTAPPPPFAQSIQNRVCFFFSVEKKCR